MAMKIQVAVGECFDAKHMVEIASSRLYQPGSRSLVCEKLLKAGAYCRIAPTVNPGFNLEFCREHLSISPKDEELMERTRNAYREIGATLTFSCTPYLEANVPRFGEIISYSETSATAYVNSVIEQEQTGNLYKALFVRLLQDEFLNMYL